MKREASLQGFARGFSRLAAAVHLHSRRVALEFDVTGLELSLMRWIAAGQPATLEELVRRTELPTKTLGELIEALRLRDLLVLDVRAVGAEEEFWIRLWLTRWGMVVVDAAPASIEEQVVGRFFEFEEEEREALKSAAGVLLNLLSLEEGPLLAEVEEDRTSRGGSVPGGE